MISLLDPRVWLVCAGLTAAGFVGGYAKRWAGESARWEARIAATERAAALKLIRIHDKQMEAMTNAQAQTDAARRDAAAAGSAAGRLRQRVTELANRAAAACPSPAAGDPIGVLADVLRRADDRAGILADYADRARIAGQACERAYDALIER